MSIPEGHVTEITSATVTGDVKTTVGDDAETPEIDEKAQGVADAHGENAQTDPYDYLMDLKVAFVQVATVESIR